MAKSKYATMMAEEEAAGFGPDGFPVSEDTGDSPSAGDTDDLGKLTDDVNAVLSEDDPASGGKAAVLAKELKVPEDVAQAMVTEAESRPELADLDGKALADRLKSDYSLRMSIEEAVAEGEGMAFASKSEPASKVEPAPKAKSENPFAKE